MILYCVVLCSVVLNCIVLYCIVSRICKLRRDNSAGGKFYSFTENNGHVLVSPTIITNTEITTNKKSHTHTKINVFTSCPELTGYMTTYR